MLETNFKILCYTMMFLKKNLQAIWIVLWKM